MTVAHNLAFDAKIVRASLHAEGCVVPERKSEFCTMQKSKNILNLPPTAKMLAANMRTAKSPTLGEAYEFFTGQKLQGAHDGLADAYACRRVFHALLDRTAPKQESAW
jgi:DNA polymerase-3 subunit epsilon